MKRPIGLLACLVPVLFGGTAEVAPQGVGLGSLMYTPFRYTRAWDDDRNDKPIAADLVDQVNAFLGAPLVDGTYTARYEFWTLGLTAGMTERTTVQWLLPWYRSQVRQRIQVAAPPPQDQEIRAFLASQDLVDGIFESEGFGDFQLWVFHQYVHHPAVLMTAGVGWRSPLLAELEGSDTEKLNVGTREAETLLLNHNIDWRLHERVTLNYRIELQYPFEGRREIFVPGQGAVRVDHTPGWYLTHELEAKTHWFSRRVTAAYATWYRREGKSEVGGIRDAGERDYLWHKLSLSYSGVPDYEAGRLPFPFLVDVIYWDLIEARNTRAYFDSHWEFQVTVPLWRR